MLAMVDSGSKMSMSRMESMTLAVKSLKLPASR